MRQFVVNPDGDDCYGKYEAVSPPSHIPESDIVEVDDLSNYTVINWEYEDY